MVKFISTIILLALSFSVFAQGNIESKKSQIIDRLNSRLQQVESSGDSSKTSQIKDAISCIQSASSREDMQSCRNKMPRK